MNFNFTTEYKEHEALCYEQAEADGSVFLPNLPPSGPVDYIFVCMEPSLGRWAGRCTLEEARTKVREGVRNFGPSGAVAILHYAARKFLCAQSRYYITDLSKGAMFVKHADSERIPRWDRWFPIFELELQLVSAPGAKVIAVGCDVRDYLTSKGIKLHATILHYSPLAVASRKKAVKGREIEFEQFKPTARDIKSIAYDALAAYDVPEHIRGDEQRKIDKLNLSDSLLQLAFSYKLSLSDKVQASF